MTTERVVLVSLSAAMDGGFTAVADVSTAMTAAGAADDYRLIGGVTVMLRTDEGAEDASRFSARIADRSRLDPTDLLHPTTEAAGRRRADPVVSEGGLQPDSLGFVPVHRVVSKAEPPG